MISVKDIFGRSYLETRSEYRLAMALAMEGARRGNLLDFSGVRSRAGLGSPVYAGYKNYLIENNLVRGATVKESDFYLTYLKITVIISIGMKAMVLRLLALCITP